MIEERGRVVALEESGVWVETVQRSGCHGCAAKSGCGTGLLGDFWAKASQVRVSVPPRSLQHINLHDTVVIGVAENTLAISALVVYLLPLVMLVLGAVAGDALMAGPAAEIVVESRASELGAIAGAVAGLVLGALLIRFYSHHNRNNPAMAPQFLRVEADKPCTIPSVQMP